MSNFLQGKYQLIIDTGAIRSCAMVTAKSSFHHSFQGEVEMSEDDENLFEFLESCVGCRTFSNEQFRTFERFHDSDQYRSELKALTNLVLIADWPEARRVAMVFNFFEINYHQGLQEETELCLKRNLVS